MKYNVTMGYSNVVKQKALLSKKEDINEYFRQLGERIPTYLMELKKHELIDNKYVDAFVKIGNKRFAFRFLSSKFSVEISDNKYWRLLKSDETKMKDKLQKNPMKWFPDTIEADYYIYPIKNIKNLISYKRSMECVGDYEHTMQFVIKKINKNL